MLHQIKINSISYYGCATLNCTVNCYLKQEDMDKDNASNTDNNMTYSIPFQVNLQQCNMQKLTKSQVLDLVKTTGENLYNQSDHQSIIAAIEYGASLGITTPQIV